MKFIHIFFFFSFFCFSQEYNISGYVTDQNTGETLIGANVYNTSSKKGATSNSYGYFSLNIPKGETLITCSYIGYKTDSLNVNITSDLKYNFEISTNTKNLNEST